MKGHTQLPRQGCHKRLIGFTVAAAQAIIHVGQVDLRPLRHGQQGQRGAIGAAATGH